MSSISEPAARSRPGYTFKLAQHVPTVTLQEVNALAKRWLIAENRIITVQAPEKPGVKCRRKRRFAALDRVERTTVAYTETVSNEPLIARLLPPGKVLGEKARPAVGITEWTLSNGARVVVKPTDFRADQVLFGAYSLGGRSLLPDADVITAQMAGQIAMSSGAGTLNRTDLTKRLAGKAARYSRTSARPVKPCKARRRRKTSRRSSSSCTCSSRHRDSIPPRSKRS
jgi:zinc protease